MSNGKKFILMVAAIVIPCIIVAGVVVAIFLWRSGDNSQLANSVYVDNTEHSNTSDYADIDNFEISDSETAHKAIIGKWEKTKVSSEPQFAETIEFFVDGTYQEITVTEKNDTLIDNGQFSFATPGRIKFQLNERIYRKNDDPNDFKEKKNSIFINDITFISSTSIRITYTSKDGGLIKKEYMKQ